MELNKVILWPVIISFVGHAALISVSSIIDMNEKARITEIITVDIKEPQNSKQSYKSNKEKKAPKKTSENKDSKTIKPDEWREANIDLNTTDVKYTAYLKKIKNKILQIWEYPKKAYERNEEGISIVKISVDADGRLAGTNLLTSSGSTLLDDGALNVVKAAAPFDPLPLSYNISRLHITASFNYKLVD